MVRMRMYAFNVKEGTTTCEALKEVVLSLTLGKLVVPGTRPPNHVPVII
jgi:hypothetical protein